MIRLVLPVCPSANDYWRTVVVNGHGRTYRTHEAENYKRAVLRLAGQVTPYGKDQELVMVTIWYREALRGDTGNRLKVVEDALEGVAYENDRVNGAHVMVRRLDRARPRMEILVAPFHDTGEDPDTLLQRLGWHTARARAPLAGLPLGAVQNPATGQLEPFLGLSHAE